MKESIVRRLGEAGLPWGEVRPTDLLFRDEYLLECAANHCGKFGKTWTCPPGLGDVGKHRASVLSFPSAILFQEIFPLEDSYDLDGMDSGRRKIMDFAYALGDSLRKESGEFLFLGAGSCELCSPCGYPSVPCRFPEKAMISLEALGTDVYDLAKKAGLRYYNGPATVTYFILVLFREDSSCRP